MERKTPLYQTHVDAGGKIVEFGGFLMPVQYPTGVLAEHMAVRQKAGLFDVSHMGELRLKGPDAIANVQKLITADISAMQMPIDVYRAYTFRVVKTQLMNERFKGHILVDNVQFIYGTNTNDVTRPVLESVTETTFLSG